MASTRLKDKLKVSVLSEKVLGVDVVRGYARLCDLAAISKADIYDQEKNPKGTQRDLNPKHARDAYNYVANKELAFWPEVFLCVRNKKVFSLRRKRSTENLCDLYIDTAIAKRANSIAISRVDGNHRLHLASGEFENYPPIEKYVSFCLAYDLNRDEEIALFRDINNNQRRMNTSHLDKITVRLEGEAKLRSHEPELYIAQMLGKDIESPFKGRLYEGGKKSSSAMIPLRSLRTGISYMLSRPTKLNALGDPDVQHKVIRNYFQAVKKWVPEAWDEPSKYLLLRGAGLWGVCFLGAEVIDRALSKGNFKPNEMYKILKSGPDWDWSNKGSFQGLSGRGGALRISELIVSELQDASGVSVKSLFKEILNS